MDDLRQTDAREAELYRLSQFHPTEAGAVLPPIDLAYETRRRTLALVVVWKCDRHARSRSPSFFVPQGRLERRDAAKAISGFVSDVMAKTWQEPVLTAHITTPFQRLALPNLSLS
jgi:hypothetical protein